MSRIPGRLAIGFMAASLFLPAASAQEPSFSPDVLMRDIDAVWQRGDLRDMQLIEQTFGIEFGGRVFLRGPEQDGKDTATELQYQANSEDHFHFLYDLNLQGSKQTPYPSLAVQPRKLSPETHIADLSVDFPTTPCLHPSDFDRWASQDPKRTMDDHVFGMSLGVEGSGCVSSVHFDQYVGPVPPLAVEPPKPPVAPVEMRIIQNGVQVYPAPIQPAYSKDDTEAFARILSGLIADADLRTSQPINAAFSIDLATPQAAGAGFHNEMDRGSGTRWNQTIPPGLQELSYSLYGSSNPDLWEDHFRISGLDIGKINANICLTDDMIRLWFTDTSVTFPPQGSYTFETFRNGGHATDYRYGLTLAFDAMHCARNMELVQYETAKADPRRLEAGKFLTYRPIMRIP